MKWHPTHEIVSAIEDTKPMELLAPIPQGIVTRKYDFYYSYKRGKHHLLTLAGYSISEVRTRFIAMHYDSLKSRYPALASIHIKETWIDSRNRKQAVRHRMTA
jgi:hypothetical protein